MEREELLLWLKLHLATGIGAIRFKNIIRAFGSIERALNATISELAGVDKIGRATATQIYETLKQIEPQRELESAERKGIKLITIKDKQYPELLKACPDSPAILYVKGELPNDNELRLAVVGTRKPTRYGYEQTERFSAILASAGFTIVSGMARGIDSCAHLSAITASGKTIAVMGSGFNHIYPPENKELVGKIVETGGAVITEYPMNIAPSAGNFPTRNRIVAGLSLGVLVTEAPKNSGALITAHLALEYNREVFAIPGAITGGRFDGNNQLIKESKAKLVTKVEDILDEFGQAGETLKEKIKITQVDSKNNNLSPRNKLIDAREQSILEFLTNGPADIDTISSFCNLEISEACSLLTTMQIKGLVKPLPGNQFAKSV